MMVGGRSISIDRKSTRLNSSHRTISYAVFCLKKKKQCIHHTNSHCLSFLITLTRPPTSTLFPYTTLFRSWYSHITLMSITYTTMMMDREDVECWSYTGMNMCMMI